MCAYYYVGDRKMKRSITIGFDAQHAMEDGVEFGAYSRMVIEAMALAAPRHTYIRAYTPERTPHADYEAIERLHNVETMEPDGGLWRKLQMVWQLWHISRDLRNGNVELYHGLEEHIPLRLAKHNIRSVVTIHNMAYVYDRSILNSPENLIQRLYMGHMLHRVDRIVAVSECVRRDIIKRFHIDPEKVDVVYSGIAKPFTEPVSDDIVIWLPTLPVPNMMPLHWADLPLIPVGTPIGRSMSPKIVTDGACNWSFRFPHLILSLPSREMCGPLLSSAAIKSTPVSRMPFTTIRTLLQCFNLWRRRSRPDCMPSTRKWKISMSCAP